MFYLFFVQQDMETMQIYLNQSTDRAKTKQIGKYENDLVGL